MSMLAEVVLGLPPMVVGPEVGVAFPTSIEALYTAGPDFLTAAFHAAGAIAADNRVTAITKASEFFGGGMGRKLWLDVDYAHHQPGLHRELFVKFPRDFGDPLRDLFAPLMAPEVRFALLSRRPNFPIEVARCYFADYEPVTKSGLLITQRIAFGKGEIERALDKCCDAELADSLPYYRAMTRAMATLAAHHQSGKLGNLDQSFPYRPDEDVGARIPFPREALAGKIAALRALAETAPGLFQDKLGDRLFLDQFAAEAELAMANEDAIRAFLARNSDLVALCHWNMNIDNAWFRRDSASARNTIGRKVLTAPASCA